MILIRADANSEIGMGHIMRCLSIADALKERGAEVCFAVADENPVPLLTKRGMPFVVLHSDYQRPEAELPALLLLLTGEKGGLPGGQFDFILCDSYFITEKYLREVGKYVKTAYLDDKCETVYPVDLLINYNIYGEAAAYPSAISPKTQTLFGAAYAPLRKEFAGTPYGVRKQAEHVLITTGGSDKYNLAGKLLETVLKDVMWAQEPGEIHFHVVSGAFNQYFDGLCALAEKHTNIQLHQNVTNMSELMRRCDIAVTAGGSTMYELSAVGVPIICFSFVDNQERIVETFVKKGLVCYGGNYLTEKDAMVTKVSEKILYLKHHFEERVFYSQREKALVDGLGAGRIAEALLRATQK